MRTTGALMAAAICFTFLGCSQVRFYDGPELPPEQESVLQIGNALRLTLFDNNSPSLLFAGQLIRALPGRHQLLLDVAIGKGKSNCSRSRRIPSDSEVNYDKCVRDNERNDSIVGNLLLGSARENCFERYVRTFEICDYYTLYGSCNVLWNASPGRHELVRLDQERSWEIIDRQGMRLATGQCRMEAEPRSVTKEEQI